MAWNSMLIAITHAWAGITRQLSLIEKAPSVITSLWSEKALMIGANIAIIEHNTDIPTTTIEVNLKDFRRGHISLLPVVPGNRLEPLTEANQCRRTSWTVDHRHRRQGICAEASRYVVCDDGGYGHQPERIRVGKPIFDISRIIFFWVRKLKAKLEKRPLCYERE